MSELWLGVLAGVPVGIIIQYELERWADSRRAVEAPPPCIVCAVRAGAVIYDTDGNGDHQAGQTGSKSDE